MKVYGIVNYDFKRKNYNLKANLNKNLPLVDLKNYYSKDSISFTGNISNKNISSNINQAKAKLLKQIDEILKLDIKENVASDDYISNAIALVKFLEKQYNKGNDLYNQYLILGNSSNLNLQQRLNILNEYKKNIKSIKNRVRTVYTNSTNSKDKTNTPTNPKANSFDFKLLNKLKSSLLDENFNLLDVFKDYYGLLNDINSVTDLKIIYPSIEFPEEPYELLSNKLISYIPKSFYLNLNQYRDKQRVHKEIDNYITSFLTSALKNINYKDENINILKKMVINKTFEKFYYLKYNDKFSTIQDKPKTQKQILTEDELNYLDVDYNDFIISIIKEQYLNLKKTQDLTYRKENTEISIKNLQDLGYKFGKIPEKIKKIIKDAQKIHEQQRNYDNYSIEDFKNRLNFYSNNDICDNENILEVLVDFANCKFTEVDIAYLKIFLKYLDSIVDKKTSIDSIVENIKSKNIRPHGTNHLIKEAEYNKYRANLKQAIKLAELKKNFDDSINILYENNQNRLASNIIKYRPNNLNKDSIENSEYIINVINSNNIENKLNISKLNKKILYWDTYNHYKTSNIKPELVTKSEQLAKNNSGIIDKEKAGEYIIKYELINNYPQTKELYDDPDFLEYLKDKDLDIDSSISLLSKHEKYLDLLEKDENIEINKLLKLFDIKDSTDKPVLKYIIEHDYINDDTIIKTQNNDEITSIFDKKAKKAIFERYKFPLCITYLANFEDAMKSYATNYGMSGIKKLSTSKYNMELKIKGFPDRLFSSNNDFIFDIYSEKGLH